METTQRTTAPGKRITHSTMEHNQANSARNKYKYLRVATLVLVILSVMTSINFAFAQSSTSTATIRGAVFYNDQRTHGLFSERRDNAHQPGSQSNSTVGKPDCSAIVQGLTQLRHDRQQLLDDIEAAQPGKDLAKLQAELAVTKVQIAAEEQYLQECQDTNGPNWLGGKYMVVDVIERDVGLAQFDNNCHEEEVLTSATVEDDGSFTATFSTDDPCEFDLLNLSYSAIELRVRLRFCNSSYCFSINENRNDPYTLTHPRASASNPMPVQAGDDITMTTLNFSTASDPALPNNDSIAANYYASIVDTILTLHKDSTIPFYKEEFDEIQFIFPSPKSSTATALSPTEVAISTFESQPEELGGHFAWVDGKMPAHEYGHIMMQRTWGGSYGFDGVGTRAVDDEKAPSQQIAFKEAWAEFITRVVFPVTRGCDRSGFDDNANVKLNGPLGEGTWWRGNIIKALCDWYDANPDDDLNLAGAGDHFTVQDIYPMWQNLRYMYVDADKYGGQYWIPGLWFCDYVRYYLDVRKSASAVGQSAHDSYENSIRDLIYNNNIGCFMTPPN